MKTYIINQNVDDLSALEYIEALEFSYITGRPLWYVILEKRGKRKQSQSLVERAVKEIMYDTINTKRWFPILKVVGKKYITYEICREAVTRNGFNLRFCPEEYLTKEMCMLALSENGGCLQYIPESMRTYDLCDMAVAHDMYYGYAIESVPLSIIKKNSNNKWYEKAVVASANAIQFIPDNEITSEIAHIVMAHILNDASNYDYFDEIEIEKDICKIPRKYITTTFINEFAQNKPECAKHLLTKLNLDTEHQETTTKTFALNDKQDSQKSLLTPRRTPKSRCIYYISDIHLEHQFELSMSEKFNYEELKRCLCAMIEPMTRRLGICLLGGDIADSVEREAIFFCELQSVANSSQYEFITVLGNHELWNGNPHLNAKFENVDAIVEAYRKAMPQQVTLLQNALYIRYGKFEIPIVFEEQVLLNISVDDLQTICRSSSILILGGIGFSGLETRFNGGHGLYGLLVDEKEDVEQTNRFRKIYEKILSVANDVLVIILTHTPITNWTNAKPNPRWIYIYGHTHQNKRLDNNVYCDNQVGYKPKSWRLKSIDIDSFLENRDYSFTDGIHRISNKEYDDLLSQRKLWVSHLKFNGDIFALKWQDYFMFVLQSNCNLFLLDGGKKLKLPNNASYYLHQLPTYISNLHLIYKKYWHTISTISQEVKYIGGNGRIHGCIVDIDSYHHIYCNPFDGTITPYFALNTVNKIAYSNLTQLIENTPCQQIRSYQGSKTIKQLYEQAVAENKIPTLTKKIVSTIKSPIFSADTSIYLPSKYFLKLQYFFENQIIRIWDDGILSANHSNYEIQGL